MQTQRPALTTHSDSAPRPPPRSWLSRISGDGLWREDCHLPRLPAFLIQEPFPSSDTCLLNYWLLSSEQPNLSSITQPHHTHGPASCKRAELEPRAGEILKARAPGQQGGSSPARLPHRPGGQLPGAVLRCHPGRRELRLQSPTRWGWPDDTPCLGAFPSSLSPPARGQAPGCGRDGAPGQDLRLGLTIFSAGLHVPSNQRLSLL